MAKTLAALFGSRGDGDPQRVIPDTDVFDGELVEDLGLASARNDEEGDDEEKTSQLSLSSSLAISSGT
jgi:hypothetical protein